MIVKVGRTSGAKKNYSLNAGATVRDALNKADITTSGSDEVYVNGERTSMDQEVCNGDKITVASMVKGN